MEEDFVKKIVVPGEVLTEERKKLLDNVFIKEGKIMSTTLGIATISKDVAGVVALHGRYMPRRGDLIIGIVRSENIAGYILDINSFYFSFISKRDLSKPLRKGDVVSAKIVDVNEINEASLADVRVFYGGNILSVSPTKIPRMIGKQGSMLNVLKNGTKCSLMIGRNGFIWAKGGSIFLLRKALRKIEEEAHQSNLTNKVESFLNENKKEIMINEENNESQDEGELNE